MPQVTDPIERLVEELRIRVGSPDEEELNRAELRRFVAMALDNVNRDRPAIGLGYFTTAAGQSAYDVVPGDAYKLVEVYYWPSLDPNCCAQLWGNWAQLMPNGFDAGVRLVDHPSLIEVFEKRMEPMRRRARGVWNREIDDGFVTLAPTPTDARPVYFRFLKPRFASVDLLTKWYEPYLMLRAEVYAFESLAAKRSGVVAGSGPSGSYRTGGGELQVRQAQQRLEEYQQQFRNAPAGIVRG